jgi:hypothetical protein
VAEVTPPSARSLPDWLGSMKEKIAILGDIVSPASVPVEWQALRD